MDSGEGLVISAFRPPGRDAAISRASTPKSGFLLVITVWAFCRFYYFAFYVTQTMWTPAIGSMDSFRLLDTGWEPKKADSVLLGRSATCFPVTSIGLLSTQRLAKFRAPRRWVWTRLWAR